MTDEVRTEAPEKISGELPKVESTVSKEPAASAQPQPMVMNPDGTRRPASADEIAMFQKTQECGKAVQAVLDNYGCDLDVSMVISPRGVIPQVQIVPRAPKQDNSTIVTPDSKIITP